MLKQPLMSDSATNPPTNPPPTARAILKLAIPALVALIAHPLYTLADAAIIGRIGTTELASVGAGSTIVTTVVGLCIFLTYGANVRTATARGAGDYRKAAQIARENWWLALILGIALAIVLAWASAWLTGLFDLSSQGQLLATDYLKISCVGLPALLVALAATGGIRGFGDTLSPMFITLGAATTNVILDIVFVLVWRWGVVGAAWATVIAESLAAVALTIALVRHTAKHQTSWLPKMSQVCSAATANVALILRTLSARLGLVATALLAGQGGDTHLAAFHITMALTGFLVMALDALAIAAQTLVAESIGARHWQPLQGLTKRLIRWSLALGVVLGLAVFVMRFWLPTLFTADLDTRQLTATALVVLAIGQPLAAYVFIMDGIIMASQRMLFLAWSCTAATLAHVAALAAIYMWVPQDTVFVALWVSYCALFIGVRGVTQLWWWTNRWRPEQVLTPAAN